MTCVSNAWSRELVTLRRSIIFGGNVIIVIEGIHNFIEFETKLESDIKFWLPHSFPKRVRVIVSSNNRTKSFGALERRKSTIVKVMKDHSNADRALDKYSEKKFICPKDYVDVFLKNLRESIGSECLDDTAITYCIGFYCPYYSKGILEHAQVNAEACLEILSRAGDDMDIMYDLIT